MSREKFSVRVDAKTLAAVRLLAGKEKRQLQSLVEEALANLLEKRRMDRPRPGVMEAYERSLAQYGDVYRKLSR